MLYHGYLMPYHDYVYPYILITPLIPQFMQIFKLYIFSVKIIAL